MKIYMAQINPLIGAFEKNRQKIIQHIECAKSEQANLIVFSEMCVCGYMPQDLLLQTGFVDACEKELELLAPYTKGITAIVGTVRHNRQLPGKPFRNSAVVFDNGKLVGFQDKCLLPTYDVFDESRYFEPAVSERIWELCGKRVGITICEDIWPSFDPFCHARYSSDPLKSFEGKGLDLLINISASPYTYGKTKTRKKVAKAVALRLSCPVVLVNQVGAQDGLIFDGTSVMVDATGKLCVRLASFSEDQACFELNGNQTAHEKQFHPGQELLEALVLGVRDYFHKQGFTKACLGLSGGIDSAVVAAIAVEALGKENVLGLLLPSRFTTSESREDALRLAANLGIQTKELSIEEPFVAMLNTVEPHFGKGPLTVTEENIQSRIRGMLLMAISNKWGYLLLNTGNKSELAMGYTTLYGDACGALGVIGDLLKHQVYEVASWINRAGDVIPKCVITKEPTAELRPDQKDTDTLPPYPVLDAIVEAFVVRGETPEEIAQKEGFDVAIAQAVCRQIHLSEYKRRQAPLHLRVSEKAFASGRHIPIVHSAF